ncbi:MAG TPA: AAA family ATPase, partial [Acetobacteraceae bacterium]
MVGRRPCGRRSCRGVGFAARARADLPCRSAGGTIGRVAPDLLERREELHALAVAVEQCASGRGCTALVSGEAGIGKTSVVRSFLAELPNRVRVLAGGCEDLLTPRTFGPLRDAARSSSGPLARALMEGVAADGLFSAVLDELTGAGGPTVLVVDDAHWADGATLDILRFLGRRMTELPALLVVTYREDAVGRNHPLRSVLGDLAGPATLRLRLQRLSADAVDQLCRDVEVDAAELYRLTGGNPFFVTEVLAAPDQLVPPTVVDAVLARVGRLSDQARTAVERLAVVPAGVELDVLRTLQPDLAPIAEAERAGVLTMRGQRMAFRHELARRAVAGSLPAAVRIELHADVLRALLARDAPDPFRVLHHAIQAGDDAAVVSYGQQAAREARRAGAHRQAAACYAQVLARVELLPAPKRAALGEAYS